MLSLSLPIAHIFLELKLQNIWLCGTISNFNSNNNNCNNTYKKIAIGRLRQTHRSSADDNRVNKLELIFFAGQWMYISYSFQTLILHSVCGHDTWYNAMDPNKRWSERIWDDLPNKDLYIIGIGISSCVKGIATKQKMRPTQL